MAGYAEIAAHYRKEIGEGRLAPGDPLPSYAAITSHFSVNRTTAIRAYDVLKAEGLIASTPGKGTVVLRRPRVVVTGAQRADRIDAGGPDYAPGETVTGRGVAMQPVTDSVIAQELGIQLHEEAVIRRRVFRVEGVPSSLALTVIHARTLADVPEILVDGPLGDWRPMYEERTGRRLSHSPERRTARLATREELAALEVPLPDADVAVPVLVAQSTYHDENGPLFVMEDVYRPGTWQYSSG